MVTDRPTVDVIGGSPAIGPQMAKILNQPDSPAPTWLTVDKVAHALGAGTNCIPESEWGRCGELSDHHRRVGHGPDWRSLRSKRCRTSRVVASRDGYTRTSPDLALKRVDRAIDVSRGRGCGRQSLSPGGS